MSSSLFHRKMVNIVLSPQPLAFHEIILDTITILLFAVKKKEKQTNK
jgi:hypothetical protein